MANQPVEIGIGVLGCGTVGASFVTQIHSQRDQIAARSGVDLNVVAIAVRDVSKDRSPIDPALIVGDPADVVGNDAVQLVVETMGGSDSTLPYVIEALRNGKSVVTANKELLAQHGPELYKVADESGSDLLFEAAVAAGIPFIRPLRDSLVGEQISRVMGIVNGTTNFILSQMTENGADYGDALAEAQALGFAEADPTADVEGLDAGAKAAIIATLAFGQTVTADQVHTEGISKITADDIALATRLGYVIKLLAIVDQSADGDIGARVHPAMVAADHPLASVRDSFNAVYVEGPNIDQVMFYGRGAGGGPTAAMMVGDAIDAAKNLAKGQPHRIGDMEPATVLDSADLSAAFYISLDASDERGVLAEIAGEFANHDVSIRSMEQEGLGDQARLSFITHLAVESAVEATLEALGNLSSVRDVRQVIRVIEN